MEKSKKQIYIAIGAFALVLLLGGVTYAFFNYTRTGSANVIKTGRIYFNSEQGTAINLTNMFPIDVSNGIPNDNTKVGTVTLNVIGDTTYDEGIEYLVSAVNVQNTIGSGQNVKSLPISIDVSVASNTTNDPATTLGTSDDSYYTNRGGNSSIYKVLADDTISTNEELLVGYITKGSTGIDGNIVIKAYLDASKILISDTYNNGETPTDNLGTPASLGEGKTVFTTTEWNSLQASGVSFQIKVESNEGIWVEDPNPPLPTLAEMCPGCVFIYQENEELYTTWNTANQTPTTIIDFSSDYHDVLTQRNVFNGVVLNMYGEAERVFACSTVDGIPFCVEGAEDNSKFSQNVQYMDALFGTHTTSEDTIEYRFGNEGGITLNYDGTVEVFYNGISGVDIDGRFGSYTN